MYERGVVLKKGYKLRDLYEEREPLYEKHADYIIELGDDSVEDSAKAVLKTISSELSKE